MTMIRDELVGKGQKLQAELDQLHEDAAGRGRGPASLTRMRELDEQLAANREERRQQFMVALEELVQKFNVNVVITHNLTVTAN